MTFDLILIGYGNVARRFVGLLEEQRAALAAQHGLSARVIGIVTRHGEAFAASGLDTARIRLKPPIGNTQSGRAAERPDTTQHTLAFLRDALHQCSDAAREQRLVVVETTTLDINRGEPAATYIRTALGRGAHVITTNKGPVACAYRSLLRTAEEADRRWLFEGTVMDGVPLFNMARETLRAVTIVGFRGVVNRTTNFMLTAMEQGQAFDDALREMQAMGIAEADVSLDVDGWDAAAKTAALANVLLDARLTPADVEREGISRGTRARAVKACEAGRRLKLVARASREGRRVTARVALEELAGDDLLAELEGQQNALILYTDLLDEIAIVQRGGGLTQTAYALLSDLLTIGKDATRFSAIRRSPRRARRG